MTGDTADHYDCFDPKRIETSDILCVFVDHDETVLFRHVYGLWVNDTQLSNATTEGLEAPKPASSFPFTRLAGFSPLNSTYFFVYHQLNETAFAEDKWDILVQDWVSKDFTILPS